MLALLAPPLLPAISHQSTRFIVPRETTRNTVSIFLKASRLLQFNREMRGDLCHLGWENRGNSGVTNHFSSRDSRLGRLTSSCRIAPAGLLGASHSTAVSRERTGRELSSSEPDVHRFGSIKAKLHQRFSSLFLILTASMKGSTLAVPSSEEARSCNGACPLQRVYLQ